MMLPYRVMLWWEQSLRNRPWQGVEKELNTPLFLYIEESVQRLCQARGSGAETSAERERAERVREEKFLFSPHA